MHYAPKVINEDDFYGESGGEEDQNMDEGTDKEPASSTATNLKTEGDDEAAYPITDDAGYTEVLS